MRKIVLLSALVLLVGASAFAEGLPNYAALKLGMYIPQATDVEDFDNAFYGELAFGHYFNKNFAIELGAGYTKSSASLTISDTVTTLTVDADLTIIPVTLGVKGLLPMGNFEPYAMAGIGAYFAEVEGSASLTGVGSGSTSESDTAFGYYLGLGANFNITKEILLGIEWKYTWAKPNFFDEDVKIDGSLVTANIGYRF